MGGDSRGSAVGRVTGWKGCPVGAGGVTGIVGVAPAGPFAHGAAPVTPVVLAWWFICPLSLSKASQLGQQNHMGALDTGTRIFASCSRKPRLTETGVSRVRRWNEGEAELGWGWSPSDLEAQAFP